PAIIDRATVLVAATECSAPALIGKTSSDALAAGDFSSLTMASVTAPNLRASSVALMRSGLRPDCETTAKRAPWKSGGRRYAVMTEGAEADASKPSLTSKR